MLNIVLYQPSIPPNTGNIGRLCVGMNANLHLIGPLEMDLSSQAVRRAGLDYWPNLNLTVHSTPDEFLVWLSEREPWLITKFGETRFDAAPYQKDDVLILGNEVKGLPEDWLKRWEHRCIYIPVLGEIRCYNLANAAAIVIAQASVTAGIFED
jgi:tRNA (cytidine/uridine-2'-O-)-methyltransferase